MNRPGLLLTLLVLALACAVYALKASVRTLEYEIRRTERQIAIERIEIGRLRTEWAFLNRPDRLERLAERHLGLAPPDPMRIVAFADIPFRTDLRQGRRSWLATLPSGAVATLRLKPHFGLEGLPPALRIEDLLE